MAFQWSMGSPDSTQRSSRSSIFGVAVRLGALRRPSQVESDIVWVSYNKGRVGENTGRWHLTDNSRRKNMGAGEFAAGRRLTGPARGTTSRATGATRRASVGSAHRTVAARMNRAHPIAAPPRVDLRRWGVDRDQEVSGH